MYQGRLFWKVPRALLTLPVRSFSTDKCGSTPIAFSRENSFSLTSMTLLLTTSLTSWRRYTFVSFVFSSCLTNHREQIAKPLQGVEDFYSIPVVNTIRDEHASDSETIADDNHLFHIYGDIKRVLFLRFTLPTLSYNCEQLMPCSPDNLRYTPLLDFSGTVFNCDKDLLSFDVNAEQYLLFYKSHRALPMLPI